MSKFGSQPISTPKVNGMTAEEWSAEPVLRAIKPQAEPEIKPGSTHASIRFDNKILAGLTRTAKKKGITRSAYINLICAEALEREERGL